MKLNRNRNTYILYGRKDKTIRQYTRIQKVLCKAIFVYYLWTQTEPPKKSMNMSTYTRNILCACLCDSMPHVLGMQVLVNFNLQLFIN